MTAIAIGDSTRGAPCLRVEQCKAFSDDRRTDGATLQSHSVQCSSVTPHLLGVRQTALAAAAASGDLNRNMTD